MRSGTSLLWSMPCIFGMVLPSSSNLLSPTETPSGNSSLSAQTSTSSFAPDMDSGTTACASCAKKPSTVVSASAMKLKRLGASCLTLVMPSVTSVTFSLSR